jgi:hypothetical protein
MRRTNIEEDLNELNEFIHENNNNLQNNQTNEIIIPFDNFTKISCDYPSGNYFTIDTTGLQQERYYRILIQIQDDAEVYTIDLGKTFKITR